jgi:hypothetical protein
MLTQEFRGSSVSIVSDYGLDDRGSIPTESEDFSSSLCVQTGSGAHQASCTMGTGVPFPGGKARPGRDADHSPPSSAEVKNECIYPLTPCASMACSGITFPLPHSSRMRKWVSDLKDSKFHPSSTPTCLSYDCDLHSQQDSHQSNYQQATGDKR